MNLLDEYKRQIQICEAEQSDFIDYTIYTDYTDYQDYTDHM